MCIAIKYESLMTTFKVILILYANINGNEMFTIARSSIFIESSNISENEVFTIARSSIYRESFNFKKIYSL